MNTIAMNILVMLLTVAFPSVSMGNNDISFDQESYFHFEDWMFDELIPSTEADFQMETWMFDELITEDMGDNCIEAWMFDSLSPEYKEDNVIEAWMMET